MPLKEALEGVLTEEEMEEAVFSYDVVGDIGLIEIPEELEGKKGEIGQALLESNRQIATVLRKGRERTGDYRTREYEHLAGEDKTETVHKESGCEFGVDLATCYFSPREGTERLRIAERVSEDERVLVMFAGVGPYPIVIAKKKGAECTAVEWNPDAYEYLEDNIRRNRVISLVRPVYGDVEEEVPELGGFDRVVMPSPSNAGEYLDVALGALESGGVIHFYSTGPEEEPFGEAEEELRGAAGGEMEVLERREVLPYAPGVYKVCIDARAD